MNITADIFTNNASIPPINAPKPARVESLKFVPDANSKNIANKNGITKIQTICGGTNKPTIVPITAPNAPRHVAPKRFAPNQVKTISASWETIAAMHIQITAPQPMHSGKHSLNNNTATAANVGPGKIGTMQPTIDIIIAMETKKYPIYKYIVVSI